MLKKSFLLKVSSVDSQQMIAKYFLGAWQMKKKNPKYNTLLLPISTPTLVLGGYCTSCPYLFMGEFSI